MRVWIVSVGERPASSTNLPGRPGRMNIFADELCGRGVDVTWWSSTFDHQAKTDATPRGTRYSARAGYEVILLRAPGYARNVSVQRLSFNYWIAREFTRLAAREPRPDVIVAAFPPIELVGAAGEFARRHGVPVIADVRDLWPDIWLEVVPKFLRPLAVIPLIPYFILSRRALASMTALTGITREFVVWGARRAGRPLSPHDRDFPLGYRVPTLTASAEAAAEQFWLKQLAGPGGPPALRLCFMGNIGVRTGLHHVIEAVLTLPAGIRDRVQLVICGHDVDGHYLAEAKRRIGASASVIFAGWVDQAKLLALMRISDLGIAPYRNTVDFKNSLSNKMIEYLAGGVALLTGLDGKVQNLISEADCGYKYKNQDAASLRQLLVEIMNDKNTLARRKLAARRVYEERFRAEVVYAAFADHVLALARCATSTERLFERRDARDELRRPSAEGS